MASSKRAPHEVEEEREDEGGLGAAAAAAASEDEGACVDMPRFCFQVLHNQLTKAASRPPKPSFTNDEL